MYATIAYISKNTRWDDIDFYVSQPMTGSQLWEHIKNMCHQARRDRVRLLEISVLDGNHKEVWNWRAS